MSGKSGKSDSESFCYKDCPICPGLQHKIDKIYTALLGADGLGLTDGLVHAITQLQKSRSIESSWINVFKPLIIGLVSAGLSSAITYLLLMH